METRFKPGEVPLRLLFVFLLLAAGIGIAGCFYYDNQQQNIKREAQKSIAAIAELKANHIRMWREEQLRRGLAMREDPFLAAYAARWLESPQDDGTKNEILSWMRSKCDHLDYESVAFVDMEGRVRLVYPEGDMVCPEMDERVRGLAQIGTPELGDLHRFQGLSGIHCSLLVPLTGSPAWDARPVATILFRITPDTFLYPLIRSWPGPNETGETLLVRRDGDQIVFLNDLRHKENAALSLRIPIDENNLPLAIAARGGEAVAEGPDYRGVPTLAAVRPIPDSPWSIIAKVDLEELYDPIRERARLVTFVGFMMFLAAGVCLALIWSRQQAAFYRREYQAEREKLDLSQRYENLIRYANDIMLMLNGEGRIAEANDRAVEAYGYPREELFRMYIRDLRAPETLVEFEEQWRRIAEGEGMLFETAHLRKDGTRLSVEVSSRVVDIGGERFILSTIRDVAERKLARARILNLNRLYAVLSQVNQAVVHARDREQLLMNACRIAVEFGQFRMAWIAMADKTSGEVKSAAHYGIGEKYVAQIKISTPDVPEGRGPVGRAIREGKLCICSDIEHDPQMAPWRDAALEFQFRSLASIPIRSSRGILGAFTVYSKEPDFFDEQEKGMLEEICTDIAFGLETIEHEARRREIEEELRKSEASYRALAENLPGIVYRIFLRENGRMQFFNDMLEKTMGYSADDLERGEVCSIDPLIIPEDRGRVVEAVTEAVRRGEPFKVEYRAYHKDGTVQHFTEMGKPICGEDDLPQYIDGMIFDITELRRLEYQLRQAQKMEAIGTLAGGIAHDFNNILTPIIGYTEMALYDAREGTPLWRNLQQVLNSSTRAKDLVRQILAFSRQAEQEAMPIRVDIIVKEALKLLRGALPATIEIRQDIRGKGLTVLGDPTQIHQVLMNLCTNAAHAMKEKGGVMEVTLTEAELDADFVARYPGAKPGDYCRLSVKDTGHGMSKSVRHRVFDPYFTTKEPGEGTGLGLAVVYGIVQNCGGIVTVYSEQGKGSAFHVYFPKAETGAAPEVRARKPLVTGKGRVLFVDDERAIVVLGQHLLERLGYEATVTRSSREAYEIFSARPEHFDLVITDQTMPHMTGAELARKILEISPDTPILLCTGFSDEIDEAKAASIGIRGFIMKPIEVGAMSETIQRVMEGKS